MSTDTTDLAAAPSQIEAMRAVRLRLQRLLGIAERFTDPAAPEARLGETDLGGLTGHAMRDRYDRALVPSARQAARTTRAQLHRLRLAEAEARGVALDDVDRWVPEDAEAPGPAKQPRESTNG